MMLVSILSITMIVPSVSKAANRSTSITAAPAEETTTFTTMQTKWIGLNKIQVHAGWRRDESGVYNQWIQCDVAWSVPGTRIDITWCGVWNDGGGNGYDYADAGANLDVHIWILGIGDIIQAGSWMRTRVYTAGALECFNADCEVE